MKNLLASLTSFSMETFLIRIMELNLTIGGASMNIKTLITLLSIVLSTSLAMAEQKLAQVPIEQILNVNLSGAKKLNVSSYVVYPNSCYKPGTTFGDVDKSRKIINIIHDAKLSPGMCGQVESPEILPDFQIDKPENGTYKLMDPVDDRNLGEILVEDTKANVLARIIFTRGLRHEFDEPQKGEDLWSN